MKSLIAAAVLVLALLATAKSSELESETLYRPEDCSLTAKKGDTLSVHYAGSLKSNGKEFDSSYKRGRPFEFKLGAGQVIKGWDQGFAGMCVNERRRLTIPPELGYGARGAGSVIPGQATLVFEVELVAVNGQSKPKDATEL